MMKYFKECGKIIGYMPAPNRYRKWYREIEKAEDIPYDKRTEEQHILLTHDYFKQKQKEVSDLAQIEYTHLEDVCVEYGFFCGIATDVEKFLVNEWYVVGTVIPNTPLYDYLKETLPKQKEPKFSNFLCPPEEYEQRFDEFKKYHQKWVDEYSKF
jgi:hypothetical protein